MNENRIMNPRRIAGLALMFLPMLATVLYGTIVLMYPYYPPYWEFDKIYPPWHEALPKALNSLFLSKQKSLPPFLAMHAPSVLAGFLLLRFKSPWFVALAILITMWTIGIHWAVFAITRMGW